MPKDAIDEVTRKKMPVHVRGILEESGAVDPLQKDGGPAGGGGASSGGKKASKPGELPDDVETE